MQHDIANKSVDRFAALTLEVPTPQNSQTHSNNMSAVADKFLVCFNHFVGLALKEFILF